MSQINTHIIKRQVLEVGLPHQQLAKDIQDRLSVVYRKEIIPLLDRTFSALLPGEDKLLIQKLTIDVGVLDQDNLEEDFVRKVKSEIEETFTKVIYHARVGTFMEEVQLIPAHELKQLNIARSGSKSFQLLWEYFRTGLLFSNELATSSKPSLDQLVQVFLVESWPSWFEKELKGAIYFENIRQRILHFIPTENLDLILEKIFPERGLVITQLSFDLQRFFEILGFDVISEELNIQKLVDQIIRYDVLNAKYKITQKDTAYLLHSIGEELLGAYKTLLIEKQKSNLSIGKEALRGTTVLLKKIKQANWKISKPSSFTPLIKVYSTLVLEQALEEHESQYEKSEKEQTVEGVEQALEEHKSQYEKSEKEQTIEGVEQAENNKQLLDKALIKDQTFTDQDIRNEEKIAKKNNNRNTSDSSKNSKEKEIDTNHVDEASKNIKTTTDEESINFSTNAEIKANSKIDSTIGIDKPNDVEDEMINTSSNQVEEAKENVFKTSARYSAKATISYEDGESLYVQNAGLILTWPYLQIFFKELGLLDENTQFKNENCQWKAVHLLQQMSFSGEQEEAELSFLLNKLICGMRPEDFVPLEFDLSENEKEECHHLIQALISNWPVLKKTSVAGLQKTFIQRPGILSKKHDGWTIQIERKAFDIVLERLSWPIALIKLPWNNYLIHVQW